MQAAQGVQHATVQHATAVDTGSGEQPPHPVQRERACSRCRIVGHTGHDCPLFTEPEQVTCAVSNHLWHLEGQQLYSLSYSPLKKRL